MNWVLSLVVDESLGQWKDCAPSFPETIGTWERRDHTIVVSRLTRREDGKVIRCPINPTAFHGTCVNRCDPWKVSAMRTFLPNLKRRLGSNDNILVKIANSVRFTLEFAKFKT
jgi:hypothetical protein